MADNDKNIDQAIRNKFENFEPVPPDKVWDNIKSQISSGGGGSNISGGSIITPLIIVVAVIITMIILLQNIQSIGKIELAENTFSPENILKASNITTFAINHDVPAIKQFNDFELNGHLPYDNNKTNKFYTSAENKVEDQIPVRVPPVELSNSIINNHSVNQTIFTQKDNNSIISGSFTRDENLHLNTNRLSFSKLSNSDKIKFASLAQREISSQRPYDDYMRERNNGWSVGMFFTPEVTFYPQDTIPNINSVAIDFNVYYHFSNYFIQSGFGLKQKSDPGNYWIDYNQYLGSYEDVYLVTFDSTSQGVIPTYYTNTVDVYDTVDHFKIKETKFKYTYLDLPLLFGYGKNFSKFSYFIKGGPNVSFLIHKSIPDATDPKDQIRIINIDQKIPTRINLNWQLMLSAGIGFDISESFTFSLEPTFRYFMTPEYDNTLIKTKHPYTFGVRAGIIYRIK